MSPAWTVGLVADTHIPDRTRRLPEAVLQVFDRAGVCCILHAGDVVTPGVLAQLARLAPVYAVRGNRDWLMLRLPLRRTVQVGPFRLGLVHGHGALARYVRDKVAYWMGHPLPFRRFVLRARAACPQADVVVFGHIHYPMIRRFGAQWVVNPGSPLGNDRSPVPPSVGLLHLDADRGARPEIVFLNPPAPTAP